LWKLQIQYYYVEEIIIVIFFGFLVGLIYPIKLSKCTSQRIAIFSILIFVLICQYCGLVFWVDLYNNKGQVILVKPSFRRDIYNYSPSSSNLNQIIYLTLNPSMFWKELTTIANSIGFWFYFNFVMEILLKLFFALLISIGKSLAPFSIQKNCWLNFFTIQLSYIESIELLSNAILNEDVNYFKNMIIQQKEQSYSSFTVWYLENDQAYLTIDNYQKQIDRKGKTVFQSQNLIEKVKINDNILNILKLKIS
jgi:hypothetical protein